MLRSRNVPKTVLNIAYAQYLFPFELQKWKNKRGVTTNIKTTQQDIDIDWYSVPEVNPATGRLLCKCIDSHHLLTNLRTRTSTVGLKNVSPKAWKEVAKSYTTKLTPALVDDLVDKQSNAFAQTHFSEEVEREMSKMGYENEAHFCRLIRRWYEAEDAPSMNVNDRIDRWLELRDYILDGVDFGCFPPKTQHIKGWSVVSFEGFICGIETKLQLYGQCGSSSYCVRTASSLPAETCVGIIQDMNVNNTMSEKAKDIPRIMSSIAEVMAYKCNPDRGFHMKTSRSAVYPPTTGDVHLSADQSDDMQNRIGDYTSDCIEPRNHSFDQPTRSRTKARRKLGEITKDLDAPPKGQRPLRHSLYTCNETKLLPTKRAGYGEDYGESIIESVIESDVELNEN